MTLRICTDKLVKPNDITGLVGWFDMQDAASYTNTSGAVSAIVNKATGVTWSQGTAGSRPAVSNTGINGLPCMDFDGTDDKIQTTTDTAVLTVFATDNPFTVMYVAKFDTVDRAETVFGSANSASTSIFRGFGQNTTASGVWFANGNIGANVESSAGSNSNVNVFEWYGSSTVTLQLNGAAADPNNQAWVVGTQANTRCSLGNRPRSSDDHNFDGKLAEVLVFNVSLSLQNRTAMRLYLGAKWGVTVS